MLTLTHLSLRNLHEIFGLKQDAHDHAPPKVAALQGVWREFSVRRESNSGCTRRIGYEKTLPEPSTQPFLG